MAAKKYVVAPGYSFTTKGRIYKSGDEIKSTAFADKTLWAKYLSQKKIITVEEYEKLTGKNTVAETLQDDSAKTESETSTDATGQDDSIKTESEILADATVQDESVTGEDKPSRKGKSSKNGESSK